MESDFVVVLLVDPVLYWYADMCNLVLMPEKKMMERPHMLSM